MTFPDAPSIVRFDFELLREIMRHVEASSGRPQECLVAEPERVVWSDDHRSATFQFPGVTYLLSYRAGPRGTFVFEYRGGACLVWSQSGDVVRVELDGGRLDPFREAFRQPRPPRPDLN